MPVSAVFRGASVEVTFDQQLLAGSLATGNWSVRFNDTTFIVTAANASGQMVTLDVSPGGVGPGAQGVSYAASPADVIGLNGLAAAAFEDLPL